MAYTETLRQRRSNYTSHGGNINVLAFLESQGFQEWARDHPNLTVRSTQPKPGQSQKASSEEMHNELTEETVEYKYNSLLLLPIFNFIAVYCPRTVECFETLQACAPEYNRGKPRVFLAFIESIIPEELLEINITPQAHSLLASIHEHGLCHFLKIMLGVTNSCQVLPVLDDVRKFSSGFVKPLAVPERADIAVLTGLVEDLMWLQARDSAFSYIKTTIKLKMDEYPLILQNWTVWRQVFKEGSFISDEDFEALGNYPEIVEKMLACPSLFNFSFEFNWALREFLPGPRQRRELREFKCKSIELCNILRGDTHYTRNRQFAQTRTRVYDYIYELEVVSINDIVVIHEEELFRVIPYSDSRVMEHTTAYPNGSFAARMWDSIEGENSTASPVRQTRAGRSLYIPEETMSDYDAKRDAHIYMCRAVNPWNDMVRIDPSFWSGENGGTPPLIRQDNTGFTPEHASDMGVPAEQKLMLVRLTPEQTQRLFAGIEY